MAGWVKTTAGRSLWEDDQGNLYEDEPQVDTGAELTGEDRSAFARAFESPEAKRTALESLGYQTATQDGDVYAVRGNRKYLPDNPDLTLQDIRDIGALVPEAMGATVGGIAGGLVGGPVGAYAGMGLGGAYGTYERFKGAQAASVVPKDADVPVGEIVTSGIANALLPAGLSAIGKAPVVQAAKTAVQKGASKVAASMPKLDIGRRAANAALEQTFNVPAASVRQALGTGGKELAERVEKGDTMRTVASKLGQAPKKVIEEAGKQYANLRDQVISKDVWADHNPIVDTFAKGYNALAEVADDGTVELVGVLPSDRDVVTATKGIIDRIAKNVKRGETSGRGGISAKYLYDARVKADGLLRSRGVYTKLAKGEDIGAADQLLLDVRRAMENEVEQTADRYYQGAGANASEAYRAAKEQYRMALEFADQFGREFGVETKVIGDNVIENVRDVGQVANILRNINNKPKESQAILLRELQRIMPEYGKDVDEVFKFAEVKPWMQSDISQTGKALGPIQSAGAGMAAGAAGGSLIGAAPLGAIAGGLGGFAAGVARSPQVAIGYLPAIGEAGRQIGKAAAKATAPVRAATGVAKEYAGPVAKAIGRTGIAGEIGAAMSPKEAYALPDIGSRPKPVDRVELSSAIQANIPALTPFVKSNYGANYDRAIKAGMSEAEATQSILSSIAGREKFGAGFGALLKDLAAQLSEQTGTKVSASDVKWALQGAQ